MAKKYKGSLTLEWFNKQKAIINLNEDSIKSANDIPAPHINWVNKEDALFYELTKDGVGNSPFWVNRDDIRVKEARPLIFQNGYKAIKNDSDEYEVKIISSEQETNDIENMLIKGDNLLALNTLKKHFDNLPDSEKIKCIYIDPPYNTGKAFTHYDDNLEVSTWLTLMRDRIKVLRELLKNDGILYIQLDEKFIFHLKVMLDDVFGKENYVNFFTVKTSDPSGFKTVNPSPYDSAEYVLMYAKSKSEYNYETLYVPSEHDFGYNKYIKNIEDEYTNWEVVGLNQFIAEEQGFENTRKAKKELGAVVFNTLVSEFAMKNSKSVYQGTAIGNDAGSDMIKLRNDSKEDRDKFIKLIRDNGKTEYAYNGRQVYFYSNKIKNINGVDTPTKQLTNIWSDIPYNGISGEGNVNFTESKKPERLIKRLFDIANVSSGDYVLDSFSGSGTTVAVANKMNAKYIGVEIGDHCDTLILPRLLDVLSNKDLGGITSDVNWQGGGSFKYYHLGESIISIDEETKKGEFNWSLGKQFIQESLLQSYDFVVQDINVFPAQIFQDEENKPTVGKIVGSSNKAVYGLAFLATPQESNLTITNEEVKTIYSTLKKQSDFQSLVIYSNKGIDIAQDTIPEDLAIIKVPHAIFSELER
uniref:site-specific DNA-methyltransferase n=1 Tax=uncultured Polaribacter sp. TaxID=174711 RepID=UPI0026130C3F|nr:site-specific DNA-methyltransferase [uncultured Polaribacter sp.]